MTELQEYMTTGMLAVTVRRTLCCGRMAMA